eukprot:11273_1
MTCPKFKALSVDMEEEMQHKTQTKHSIVVTSHSNPQSLNKSLGDRHGCPYLNREDNDYTDCYYHDYLQLDKILNANKPRSAEWLPEPSHDEHLFITIHQAYELWFKQILLELDSCITFLGMDVINDRQMLKLVSRFQRINKILKLSVEQFTILETMTPMDFLDFRKYLKPASGFQSVQFRLLENRLGLHRNHRIRYNKQEYTKVLTAEHEACVQEKLKEKQSLFDVIEKWLERFPYLEADGWLFWKQYKSAVNDYIMEEKQLYLSNAKHLNSQQEIRKLKSELETQYQAHITSFNCIFDQRQYEELRKKGKVRLSYIALQAALMIMLYREEPVLQMPFRVLELSMDLDNLLTQWRNAHALMVRRMLGSKMGTGGSSGFHYLRTAAVHHKVFSDLFSLSTYMVPHVNLPQLPNSLKFFMDFPSTPGTKKAVAMDEKHLFVKQTRMPFPTLSRAETLSPNAFKKGQQKRKFNVFQNENSGGKYAHKQTSNVFQIKYNEYEYRFGLGSLWVFSSFIGVLGVAANVYWRKRNKQKK